MNSLINLFLSLFLIHFKKITQMTGHPPHRMRHARKWSELVEKGNYPRWMKKRDAIITDIETKDWIFREAVRCSFYIRIALT